MTLKNTNSGVKYVIHSKEKVKNEVNVLTLRFRTNTVSSKNVV